MLWCYEVYEKYNIPDFFIDVPTEQSSVMLYDNYQVELLLVAPDITPELRWVEFMWIREDTSYTSRKTALVNTNSSFDAQAFFNISTDFNLKQHCSFR